MVWHRLQQCRGYFLRCFMIVSVERSSADEAGTFWLSFAGTSRPCSLRWRPLAPRRSAHAAEGGSWRGSSYPLRAVRDGEGRAP